MIKSAFRSKSLKVEKFEPYEFLVNAKSISVFEVPRSELLVNIMMAYQKLQSLRVYASDLHLFDHPQCSSFFIRKGDVAGTKKLIFVQTTDSVERIVRLHFSLSQKRTYRKRPHCATVAVLRKSLLQAALMARLSEQISWRIS